MLQCPSSLIIHLFPLHVDVSLVNERDLVHVYYVTGRELFASQSSRTTFWAEIKRKRPAVGHP